MHFGSFTYLVTTLIFTGVAILIEWTFSFQRLKRYTKVILAVVVIGIVFALVGERVALSLHAWVYNPELTFNTFLFGSAVETVLYAILASVAIASAALVWSDCEESGLPLIRMTFSKFYDKLRNLVMQVKKENR
jgi:lycopene cyclase domain-containing protein